MILDVLPPEIKKPGNRNNFHLNQENILASSKF